MKLSAFYLFFFLILTIPFFGFSQKSLTNKDYEVTDDVVAIEEVVFKVTGFNEKLNYIDMYEFDNGYITDKVRIIEDKVPDQQVYLYNATKKEFSFENYNATYGDYKAQYQLVTFNHLKFYYPKTDFVVIQNKPNVLLEFSYTIQDRKITHIFEKHADNVITDTYNDYGNHIDTYNSIGQKIKSETRSLSHSDLTYGTDGLLETKKTSYGKYIDKLHNTYYSYEKDEKGNWVKRVEIEISPDNEIKTIFTTRKITYANSEITGSIYYDSTFVMWEIAIYGADLKGKATAKPSAANSTSIPYGLVWKKNDANTEYFLYNKATRISGEGVTFYVDNDLIVYLTLKNEIYKLKDFKTLTADKYHNAELLPFKPTYGVWYRETENKFRVYDANGKQINETEINKYAQNSIDVIIKGKDQEKTLLLKNYKNVELNKVFPLEILNSKNISDETSDISQTTSAKSGCISGDCQNGFGTFIWEDKRKYTGDFKNGKLEGKGTFTFTNGGKYIGEFKNHTMNGYGKEYLENNKLLYEGNYLNYKYNGKGTLYLVNGDIYEGEFKDGKKTGLGTYTWAKIDNKYIGSWDNDKQNGQGTYYDYEVNKKQEAIYKEGKVEQVISLTALSNENLSKTAIPNGLVWKKNAANTEYFLYNNGNILEGTTFWLNNHLYVHLLSENALYYLENFKTQTSDIFHKGEKLTFKTNKGFWYKNSAGGVVAYNNKCEVIKDLEIYKYNTNGIDVLLKGKNEKETLLVKNFKNVAANVLYPAEIYYPTTTTSLNSNNNNSNNTKGFQSEIDECKNKGANCLANKITDKYTSLKNEGLADESIYTRLAEDFNSICAYSAKTMFEMIFKLDTSVLPQEKYSKILAKMSAEQKANLKAHAKKITDDYNKTHTNHVPESLKGSVRKQ